MSDKRKRYKKNLVEGMMNGSESYECVSEENMTFVKCFWLIRYFLRANTLLQLPLAEKARRIACALYAISLQSPLLQM